MVFCPSKYILHSIQNLLTYLGQLANLDSDRQARLAAIRRLGCKLNGFLRNTDLD
jgi:hypothetical protein